MKNIFSIFVCACAVIAGSGCIAPMPGNVSTSVSKFDNSQEVAMEPGWVSNGMKAAVIKLGAHWNTQMGNDVVIDAEYHGTDAITGLKFRIDERFVELTPIDALTEFGHTPGSYAYGIPGQPFSARRFAASMDFLQDIMAGKNVIVRMDLSKTFSEGAFSAEKTGLIGTAKPAFKRFLARVESVKSGEPLPSMKTTNSPKGGR